MKRIIIILLIFLGITVPAISAETTENMYENLDTLEDAFFESSFVPAGDIKVETQGAEFVQPKEKFTKHMPLFKKTRLKVQSALKKRAEKSDKKTLERQKQLAKEQAQKEKEKFNKLDLQYVDYEQEELEEVSEKTDAENSEKIELVGEVKAQATENQMVLDCDKIKVDEETGFIEAIGNPSLTLPAQKIVLTSDRMLYNKDSNILKAIGNVVLTKDGTPVLGDFIQINLNEESIFMDNIRAGQTAMKLNAKKVETINDKMVFTDGEMYSEKGGKFNFVSRMIGANVSDMIVDENDKSLFLSDENSSWKVVASEVGIDASNSHDIFSVKDAEVYHNDKHIFTLPSFKAYTNKSREYFEANYPEIGSVSRFGMFAGPGFVFRAPYGSTLKFIPLINYKDEFGIGAAFKFKSSFNDTHLMYGSGSDIFRLRGKHQLDENLHLQYSSNAYMDNWFLGRRMPKYLAELVYDKKTRLNDFLSEGQDLNFRHRASVAYAQDGEYNMRSEHIKSSGIGTTRFRYMAELDQTLFKRLNKEERKSLILSMVMQGSAAVYGTGDTQFVGRMGPRLHTQYKYWMQDLTYFVTGYHDRTPMPIFDMYRYGRSNVRIREAFRVNKYLTVGWSGSVTLSDDAPNEKLFQENTFLFSIGPDDFKVNLGYDFVRKMTYFIVAVTIDTKNSSVKFDKMEIKNAERLGQSTNNDDENMAFKQVPKNTKQRLEYAQVIDIEDPNRESI